MHILNCKATNISKKEWGIANKPIEEVKEL